MNNELDNQMKGAAPVKGRPMNETMIGYALLYSKTLGAPIFPLKPRCKTPLTVHGLKDASFDESVIREWWRRWPEANIGLVTGQISKLWVLDIDPRHGGGDSLADLERMHGVLPRTPMVLTGGGGAHYYFRYPAGQRVGNRAGIAPGVDVRGDGGYLVAPPSIHPSLRTYEWSVDAHLEEVSIADAPEWLLSLIIAPSSAGSTSQGKPGQFWRDLVANGVHEGSRNDMTAKLAGHLLRRWVDPVVTLDFIRAWNFMRNRPPLPDHEVESIVNSVAGMELKRRAQKGGV